MNESNLAIAEAYYNGLNKKNLIEVSKYLHSDVHFVSPFMQKQEKEVVLDAIKGFMEVFSTLSIRAKFESSNQVAIVYDVNFPEQVHRGSIRTAALLTFKENLIFAIELFFDPRPLISPSEPEKK